MEENQVKRQNIEVTILSVDKENSIVEVENENGEIGSFPVVAPAKITYAKEGKATIGFNGNGISYIHSKEPKKTGNSFYPKKTYPPKEGYYNNFKSFTQKNTFKPSDDYVPEEKESKRIGVTKVVTDTTLQDISLIYNSMSTKGKWIVATNIFPRGDKYDAIFFISEKREGLDKQEYLNPKEPKEPSNQSNQSNQPNSTDNIKEESVGYM